MSVINFKALQGFFDADSIEWRIQQAGEKHGRVWAICVPYITNRAIQVRLDEVVGPENWRNEFRPGPDGGVMCGLSIRVGGEWVTKWGGAENTVVEGVKGGLSSAMKRAAVQWGIGRYLYEMDETFAHVHDNGRFRGKTREGSTYRWDPPRLPARFLPAADAPAVGGRAVDQAEPEPPADNMEGMLTYVREVGPRANDQAEIRVQRKAQNLKEFVRGNWSAIKEKPELLRAVVEAIEHATGTPYTPTSSGAAAAA